jgi:hypothetical protein
VINQHITAMLEGTCTDLCAAVQFRRVLILALRDTTSALSKLCFVTKRLYIVLHLHLNLDVRHVCPSIA